MTPRIAEANELTIEKGAFIVDVLSDGPAFSAGLQGTSGDGESDGMRVPVGGDTVVLANEQPIISMDDLILIISQHDVGDEITLTVLRNGDEVLVSVKLVARPNGPPQ